MSSFGTGQMSAVETGQMSAVETRQMLKSQIRGAAMGLVKLLGDDFHQERISVGILQSSNWRDWKDLSLKAN